MQFESLIFDIDGTLWDSRALVAQGYNIQLKKEGLEHLSVTAEILKTQFGKVMTEIANNLFASIPQEDRYALMERCMASEGRVMEEDECRIGYPKVKETLEELAKKHRLFIVSNSQCGYPELCMRKLGLEGLIEGHMCFGDTGTCKGETIKRLVEKHGIASACYIGDTQGDQDAADLAEMPFVYCTFGFGQVEHYWQKIDTFADLLKL